MKGERKMKGLRKKALSIVLALTMVVTLLHPMIVRAVEPTNVVQGKLPTVAWTNGSTSFSDSETDFMTISYATDGNYDNRDYHFRYGEASGERRGSYLQFDLENDYEISSIKMWRYFDDRNYAPTVIAVSESAEEWTNATVVYSSDVDNVFGFGTDLVTEAGGYAETSSGKTIDCDVTGRYVRLYACGATKTDGSINTGSHLVEFQVFGVPAQQEPETPIIEKLEASAIRRIQVSGTSEMNGSASSNTDSSTIKSIIYDDNFGDTSFWRSNEVGSITYGNPFMILKLNGSYTLNKIDYTPRWNDGAKWECTGNIKVLVVEVSADGTNWTSVTGENGLDISAKIESADAAEFPVSIEFEQTNIQYIRVSGTSSYHWDSAKVNNSICIADLALYGVRTGNGTIDKIDLETVIAEADQLTAGTYTQETWNAFQATLSSAKSVNNNNAATQTEIDDAADALRAAIDGLQRIPVMEHATTYLNVPTFEAAGKSNGQAVHPDIVDMSEYVNTEDGKWHGYRYYMATTPNQNQNSQFENPCLVASNDGLNWETPAGIINPLTNIPEEPQPYHNCDADLVYNDQTDELYLYYVWAKDSPSYGNSEFQPMQVRLFKIAWNEAADRLYSVNGTEPMTVITTTYRYDLLSPSVVKTGTDEWKMWSVNTGDTGWNNQSNVVEYRTSSDGIHWSEAVALGNSFKQEGYYHWHIDVNTVDTNRDGVADEYWAIYPAYPYGGGSNYTELFYAKSPDGLTWTTYDNPVLVPDAGSWDCDFIYRSTFLYNNETDRFDLWYSAGANATDGWRIGHTSNTYTAMLAALGEATVGTTFVGEDTELPEKRLEISNTKPLLIVPLYGQSYQELASTMQWNDTLLGRWNSIPADMKENVVMLLHASNIPHNSLKAFYEQQLEIAKANNIPVMIVTATAGLYSGYTSTTDIAYDEEWLNNVMTQYDCLKGFVITENYWTNYDQVATAAANHLKIAANHGGYVIWFEHQTQVIEGILANSAFKQSLDKYGSNFAFTWKNTPAGAAQNAETASYMQGLWLAGVIDQWGGLMDTWKWYEKRYGKLFEGTTTYANNGPNGEDEECRAVVMEPEALLGIEMLSIYANGGTIYSFEHPAYTQGINDQNTPLFENVIYETFRYILNHPAQSKNKVLENTKILFHGNLSSDRDFHTGITSNDQTLPTHSTGRYGLLPAVPSSVSTDSIPIEKVAELSSYTAMSTEQKISALNELYIEGTYGGNAYAQKIENTWILYNSQVNQNVNQSATISFDDKNVDVEMQPHTFTIMEKGTDGKISVYLNNYRVNKDVIWDGYTSTTQKWDPDVNNLFENWLEDNYMTNPADGADTFRETVYTISGLSEEPVITVNRQMNAAFADLQVAFDAENGVATITALGNGYLHFDIAFD